MKRDNLFAALMLAIISWGFLTNSFNVDAMTQNEAINEKLPNALRDGDVQAMIASLSGGADAKDEDGLTALMHASMHAGVDSIAFLLA